MLIAAGRTSRGLATAAVLAWGATVATAQSGQVVAPGSFRVTPVLGPTPGAYTQAFVVELATRVVVIDAGASRQHADRILDVVRRTGKPIAALLLTHAHVDHYGGASAIRSATVPLITTRAVARQIAEYDSLNFARFGAPVPPGNRQPDRTIGDGERLQWDSVDIVVHEVGPGESYADVWYSIDGIGGKAVVLGDLAMYGIPPFAQSGHTGDWIRSLEVVGRALSTATAIHIGHDRRAVKEPGRVWGPEVLATQVQRIREFREAVRQRTEARRLLNPDEVASVTRELVASAPENDPAFQFLYSTTANIVAAELILEAQRREFEVALRAVLAAPRRP